MDPFQKNLNQRRQIEAVTARQEAVEKQFQDLQKQLDGVRQALNAVAQQGLRTELHGQALENALIGKGHYVRLPNWLASILRQLLGHVAPQDILAEARKIQDDYARQLEQARKTVREKEKQTEGQTIQLAVN